MPLGLDYKDRIQARADEIAEERHGRDFCYLDSELRDKIYEEAMEWVRDQMCHEADLMREEIS